MGSLLSHTPANAWDSESGAGVVSATQTIVRTSLEATEILQSDTLTNLYGVTKLGGTTNYSSFDAGGVESFRNVVSSRDVVNLNYDQYMNWKPVSGSDVRVGLSNDTVYTINASAYVTKALRTNLSGNKCVQTDASGILTTTSDVCSSGSSSGTVSGSDTYVQFNDGGSSFGGVPQFTWNKSTRIVTVSGDVNIQTDGSATTRAIKVLNQTANNSHGSRLNIWGSNANGTGAGGLLDIESGAADTIGAGGEINIYAGNGGSVSGAGGGVNIAGGWGEGTGAGGQIDIEAGESTGVNSGSYATLSAGEAGTTGEGGNVFLYAKNGGSSSGEGGSINLYTGSGVGTNHGGDIYITTGSGNGTAKNSGIIKVDWGEPSDTNAHERAIWSNGYLGMSREVPALVFNSGNVGSDFNNWQLTSSATVPNQRFFQFKPPASLTGIAGGGTETITSASTVAIMGEPHPLANITITNRYALWVSGNANIANGAFLQSSQILTSNATSFIASKDNIFITSCNTAPTALASISGAIQEQIIYINGGCDTNGTSIDDAAPFKLASAIRLSADDSIILRVSADGTFIEQGRANN